MQKLYIPTHKGYSCQCRSGTSKGIQHRLKCSRERPGCGKSNHQICTEGHCQSRRHTRAIQVLSEACPNWWWPLNAIGTPSQQNLSRNPYFWRVLESFKPWSANCPSLPWESRSPKLSRKALICYPHTTTLEWCLDCRGIGPTLLGIVPYAGSKFFLYQTMKQKYWAMQAPGTRMMMLISSVSGAYSQSLESTKFWIKPCN